MEIFRISRLVIGPTLVVLLACASPARAHCDGLDGPVVKAAQRALDTRDAALALMWVQPQDEPEIRAAFEKAVAVRALGRQARELADRYFFETLVRVHRAGEGAPYTGLKPAGRDLGPAIPAADNAIDAGALEPVVTLLTDAVRVGLDVHFKEVLSAKRFKPGDIAGGREYVRAYVEFLHYVERLHEAALSAAEGHFAESEGHAERR